MKTIGLIGGMSHESSAEYYRLVNQGMKERLGGHNNARSVMVTVCFDDIVRKQVEGRWDDAGQLLAQAAGQVQAAGADFVLLCTNTMHEVAGAIEEALRIPFIHIVDPTAEALKTAGITHVGLLGTRFTMERPFYIDRLRDKHGIQTVVPDAAGRDAVHALIYDELCHGTINENSRDVVLRVINQLVEQGAQGIILGCTELTLLVQRQHTSTPLFDTAGLHAAAAVEHRSLSRAPRRSPHCHPRRIQPAHRPCLPRPIATRMTKRPRAMAVFTNGYSTLNTSVMFTGSRALIGASYRAFV